MTIGVTAKIQVKPGSNKAFESIMKQLVSAVLDNEEGCLLYALHQSRTDAQTYIVLEQYADNAALTYHAKTAHHHDFSQQLAPHVAAEPIIEVMDMV